MQTTRHIEKERNDDKGLATDLCNSMGILTFLFLLFYFLVMRAMHLHEALILSAFNIIVLLIGIWLTLNIYSKRIHEKIDFNLGFKMGLHVTMLAVIPFALFICFYLYVDNAFMDFIKIHTMYGQYFDPNIAALLVCLQGMTSGFVLTLILMQFYRKRKD